MSILAKQSETMQKFTTVLMVWFHVCLYSTLEIILPRENYLSQNEERLVNTNPDYSTPFRYTEFFRQPMDDMTQCDREKLSKSLEQLNS